MPSLWLKEGDRKSVDVWGGGGALYTLFPEAKSKVPDWGDKVELWHRVKVASGIGLPMVNVLESTLEWT